MALTLAPLAPSRATVKPRLLLLTPRLPYPLRGGDKVRIWNIARELRAHFDITLLSLCQTPLELQVLLPDDGTFVACHRVLLPKWKSKAQAAAALLGSKPMQVAYYRSKAFQAMAERLLPQHDMVCCHLVRMAPYALDSQLPKWLEMTDAISLTMRRAANLHPVSRLFANLLYRIEAVRVGKYEKHIADRFDLLTLVSDIDRQHVMRGLKKCKANVIVANNGVTLPISQESVPAGTHLKIVFLGQMTSMANRDAIRYFIDRIFPAIRERLPEVRLRLVGEIGPSDAARLGSIPGIDVLGPQANLEDVLATSQVGICPVRFGAGIQNKILDYMAHGLATVTSPVGFEGLRATADVDVLVAASSEEWIDKICLLLTDSAYAAQVAENGRRLVAKHYQWHDALAPAIEAARFLNSPRARQNWINASDPV